MADTDWIIGYAVECESPTSGTWRDTRLGGLPLWPPGEHPKIAKCPYCNRERIFLMQAFAPHPLHADRVILLFGCNSVLCSRQPESWYALRAFVQHESTTSGTGMKSEQRTESLPIRNEVSWDTDSDDDGDSSFQSPEDGVEAVERLLFQHLQISKEKPQISTKVDSEEMSKNLPIGGFKDVVASAGFLKPHFVEVATEPKGSTTANDTSDVEKLIQAYKAEEEALLLKTGEVSTWEAETDVEDTDASRAVDLFRKVIERAPEQVVRYKFGGDPVWPSYPAPVPRHVECPHCGATQVFELQLLGSVLFYLKAEHVVANTQKEAALNFMALGLYTCENDCGLECANDDVKVERGEYIYKTQEVRVLHDVW